MSRATVLKKYRFEAGQVEVGANRGGPTGGIGMPTRMEGVARQGVPSAQRGPMPGKCCREVA
eukprot:7752714-Lingulodinium_polyedra.AAC.1